MDYRHRLMTPPGNHILGDYLRINNGLLVLLIVLRQREKSKAAALLDIRIGWMKFYCKKHNEENQKAHFWL